MYFNLETIKCSIRGADSFLAERFLVNFIVLSEIILIRWPSLQIAVAETEVSALRTENDQLRHLLRKAAAGAELSSLRNENIKLRHDFDQKFSASEAELSSLRSEITQLRNATTTSDNVLPLATGSTASTFQPKAANFRPKKGYSQPKSVGPHDVKATGSSVPTANLKDKMPRNRKPVPKVKLPGALDGKKAAIPVR
jgi:hypothetical protein